MASETTGATNGAGETENGGGGPAEAHQQQHQASPDDDEHEMSLEELLYSSASYNAIVKPVALCMILSALAVIYINTEETLREGEEALANAYSTFDNRNPEQSTAETLTYSVLNALIIVCVLAAMTFVIVLLYKYRCMKVLIGYMVFSFSMLLGFLGGVMLDVAINKYELNMDVITFYLFLYNFAFVGTLSIFYQRGIPAYITQAYLIATSVILAWQLSHFDSWTSWTLLVMLALYDLCAVLTPCGPLKFLVNLMSQDDAPEMPGLIYEAQLPAEARRPGARRRRRESQQQQERQSEQSSSADESRPSTTTDTAASAGGGGGTLPTVAEQASSGEDEEAAVPPSQTETSSGEQQERPSSPTTSRRFTQQLSHLSTGVTSATSTSSMEIEMTGSGETANSSASSVSSSATPVPSPPPVVIEQPPPPPPPPTGLVPFAIAKIYRLPLVREEPMRRPSWEPLLEGQQLSPNEQLARQYTTEQLRREVEAMFPRGGGRIDRVDVGRGRRAKTRYHVKDRHGVVKRVLFVDEQGRVMEEQQRQQDEDGDHGHKDNSIKLGLGDFIFYSLLVSKAAQYSFTTFLACFLVILAGLGSTLVLLAVYQQALPALPISIFLGVIFYLLTRELIEPWIQQVFREPFYV